MTEATMIGAAVWYALQVVIGVHLLSPLWFYLIYRIRPHSEGAGYPMLAEGDYAVVVTAYEQTHSLNAVVDSILKSGHSNFLIYIVADKCDISALHFSDDRVIILRPSSTLASNTKSHFYAIQRFRRPHDRLTIIDSDNLVEPGYFGALDESFAQGFEAVQGLRKAKNMDTVFARLDAARDLYYHFYDGEVLFGLGSSATLAGSGMAFTVSLYKDCLALLDISGAGFDKVLQYQIVMRNKQIAFNPHAVVYDEKTAYAGQLVNQRARWINTWFRYFTYGFNLLGKGLLRGSTNQVLFGFTLLRPPLFLFLGLSLIFLTVNMFINPWIALAWGAGFLAFVAGFLLALHRSGADDRIYKALKSIPLFVGYQFLSLIKARKANRISVATRHYVKAEPGNHES